MRKKSFSFILICLIITSSAIVIKLGTESSCDFLRKENSYLKYRELSHSFDLLNDTSELNMLKIVQSVCQPIISNPIISLELRFAFALQLMNYFRTDIPILFFIASELAFSISGFEKL
ncbi:MAG: hypothetical protein JXA54_03375 [Candidatus Heimdallarchaeota archaeon]|nr:hypothetical protein [Candidatus Heimdallarchaeota archaeon]